MDLEALKEQAALKALEEVRSGMRLGLGSGSTVAWFLKHLGSALEQGRLTDIAGVPTSQQTTAACAALGIRVIRLAENPALDLAVDGTDEVTDDLDLIKGLGGALLREKMVAAAAARFVVIADDSKRVACLGEKSPLPVEVVRFEWRSHLTFLESVGAAPDLRLTPAGEPLVTDNGNHILDCHFEGGIEDAHGLAQRLAVRPGVVEHGLFLGMTSTAIIAAADGISVI